MRRLALVALAVGLGGCVLVDFFTWTPAPKRLHKLETTTPRPSGPLKPITVGVGPLTLPGYLDRQRLVARLRPDELEVAPDDGWAEPLERAVPRVLSANLAALIPTEPTAVQPWSRNRRVQYQVVVDIPRFDGPLNGELTLLARWRLLDGGGKELADKATTVTRPAGGSYATMAAAFGQMLEGLSRAIAAEINAATAK